MLAVHMGTDKFQQQVRGQFEYERHQFFFTQLYTPPFFQLTASVQLIRPRLLLETCNS